MQKKNTMTSEKIKSRGLDIVAYIVLFVVVIFTVYPVIWMLLGSFKNTK